MVLALSPKGAKRPGGAEWCQDQVGPGTIPRICFVLGDHSGGDLC